MTTKSKSSTLIISYFCSLMALLLIIPGSACSVEKRAARPHFTAEFHKKMSRPPSRVRTEHRQVRKHVVTPRPLRHGHVVNKLPRGYSRVWFGGRAFFYSFGVFYSSGPSGFVVVKAPVGVIVSTIPAGYRTVWSDGSAYYVYGGVFYRRGPTGYVVISPPATLIIEEEAPRIIEPLHDAGGQISVSVPVLNVRSGPGKEYDVIYQIRKGYILEVHGKTRNWLYVELPNGEFGWIMKQFTTRFDPDASG